MTFSFGVWLLFAVQLSIFEASPVHGSACIAKYLQHATYRGDISLPGSEIYHNTTLIDNKRVIEYPSVVLSPFNDEDVALTILAAQYCDMPYSIVSGGHSAAGYCLSSHGVTINLRTHMHRIQLESSGRIFVESGALWSEIYEVAAETSYVPIGGGCPTVGVAGFLLGGGWSFLSRSYGLGCDNILSATIVLANGTIVTASATHQSEMLWAMCGGGGGNFGVVTSFTLQMHEPAPVMLIGEVCWAPFEEPTIHNLWDWWLKYYPIMPDYMDITPVWLLIDNNVTDDPRLFCFTITCNNEPDTCRAVTEPLLEEFPPAMNTLAAQPFIEWQLANIDVTDAQGGFLYLTSGIFGPGVMTTDLIDELTAALHEAPSQKNLILFHIGGGRIAEVNSQATAFPHRSVELMIQIKGIWDDPEEQESNMQWVKNVRRLVEPYLSGSYVNYIDSYLSGWEEAYYGVNYPRLQKLKASLDPANFFHFNQSIVGAV